MIQNLLHISKMTTTGCIGSVSGSEGSITEEWLIAFVPIREDEIADDVTTGERVLQLAVSLSSLIGFAVGGFERRGYQRLLLKIHIVHLRNIVVKRIDGVVSILPRLIVRNKHTEGAILILHIGTHDLTNDIVALLHHRVEIGLLTIAERTNHRGIYIEIVLIVFLDVVLEQVTACKIIDVLIEIGVELRQTIKLVHHTIGSRDIDGAIGNAIERSLRKGMVLGIERNDGRTCKRAGYGVVILRDMLLHELLDDGSTIAGLQTTVFSIVESLVDWCPYGIEARAIECFRELALLGKRSKLSELRVTGNILPQRFAGTGMITCRRL